MLKCYVSSAKSAVPISVVAKAHFSMWLKKQSKHVQSWLVSSAYQAEPGMLSLVRDAKGRLQRVIYCVADERNLWEVGGLAMQLPEGDYRYDGILGREVAYAISWGLGAYQFTRYKKAKRAPARLVLAKQHQTEVATVVESIYQVRDWTNTPTDDMGPTQFAEVVLALAKHCKAKLVQVKGDALLKQNYASIHTVGRASDDPPRLLDMRWGNSKHPKVTLVGKGVCFDSGGLDIKPANYMLLMKKDMAGGAHVFGLARMIMQAKLPICLRVLVPVVENVIAGNAYRPGDVIKSRSGITIEVGNTDCEGRVILADALTEAVSEKPELLIDMTTLTGAARVALGTDLPAVFSNNDALVNAVIKHGEEQYDLMWRLPLYKPYRDQINSTIADINNNSSEPYAGAITAALFLKEFVPDSIPWLHFDMMAWNLRDRPGHPQGAEALTLRALFSYLQSVYVG